MDDTLCYYSVCLSYVSEVYINSFATPTEKNTQIITQERGLQDILLALENHGQCKDLADAACSALWSLSMEGKQMTYNCLNHISTAI